MVTAGIALFAQSKNALGAVEDAEFASLADFAVNLDLWHSTSLLTQNDFINFFTSSMSFFFIIFRFYFFH